MHSLSALILYQICSYGSFCMYFPSSVLTVKQEFPIGGTIVSICPTFGLTLKKYLL